VQQPRPETREQIIRFADYWWQRHEPGQCLAIESLSPADDDQFFDVLNPPQTLSLAMSLAEAAQVLAPVDPILSQTLRVRAATYADAFLAAPHDLQAGVYVGGYRRKIGEPCQIMPVWASVYGLGIATSSALLCCAWYRMTKNSAFLDWARACGRKCAAQDKTPVRHDGRVSDPEQAPALDAGLALELMSDLYDLTREPEWLTAGAQIWNDVEQGYFSQGLIRAACNAEWYEAQLGSAYLIHGAARFGLWMQTAASHSLEPDYSCR